MFEFVSFAICTNNDAKHKQIILFIQLV